MLECEKSPKKIQSSKPHGLRAWVLAAKENPSKENLASLKRSLRAKVHKLAGRDVLLNSALLPLVVEASTILGVENLSERTALTFAHLEISATKFSEIADETKKSQMAYLALLGSLKMEYFQDAEGYVKQISNEALKEAAQNNIGEAVAQSPITVTEPIVVTLVEVNPVLSLVEDSAVSSINIVQPVLPNEVPSRSRRGHYCHLTESAFDRFMSGLDRVGEAMDLTRPWSFVAKAPVSMMLAHAGKKFVDVMDGDKAYRSVERFLVDKYFDMKRRQRERDRAARTAAKVPVAVDSLQQKSSSYFARFVEATKVRSDALARACISVLF